MKNYNPNLHHRRSIRLKNYDYSQAGLYFITICVQDRASLFGEIIPDGSGGFLMQLNDAGLMVEKWYYELENKFPDIRCHQMVVMPNHFHCIIENVPVGADLCVCPSTSHVRPSDSAPPLPPILGEPLPPILGEHIGSPLRAVIQWFKTMTTNEYIRGVKTMGWEPFNRKLWQRNYWEHIIRTEKARINIARYIDDNIQNWGKDALNAINKQQ